MSDWIDLKVKVPMDGERVWYADPTAGVVEMGYWRGRSNLYGAYTLWMPLQVPEPPPKPDPFEEWWEKQKPATGSYSPQCREIAEQIVLPRPGQLIFTAGFEAGKKARARSDCGNKG
jgi:hypothetical protein